MGVELKMIVCDLDGTLLRKDKTMSDCTLQILEKCREKGILLAFATARIKASTIQFAEIAKPDILILDCGAVAYHGEKIIHKAMLSVGQANEIIRAKLGSDEVGIFTMSMPQGLFVSHEVDPNDPNWTFWAPTYHNFVLGINEDVFKFASEIFGEKILAQIAQTPDVAIVKSHGEAWVMIAHSRATKWNAVEAVARHFGIDTAHIAAFGDDYSDVEMLANCGFGVAMENAIPEAKAAAKFVCPSNEKDGVARWLEGNLWT